MLIDSAHGAMPWLALAVAVLAGLGFALALANPVWRRVHGATPAPGASIERELLTQVESACLQSVSSLAAGLAHEINSPIGALRASADLAERAVQLVRSGLTCAGSTEQRKLLRALAVLDDNSAITRAATQRIGTVVSALSSLSRVDRAPSGPTDLHAGLDSALRLVGHLLGSRVVPIRDYGELPLVFCNGQRINQVFVSLLHNAIQAIGDSGQVAIQTRANQDTVSIRITDTGEGIAAGDLPRVFDAGFTTRAGQNGMGLALARRIVADHGGKIEVESRPGCTSVTVTLPICPARPRSGGLALAGHQPRVPLAA